MTIATGSGSGSRSGAATALTDERARRQIRIGRPFSDCYATTPGTALLTAQEISRTLDLRGRPQVHLRPPHDPLVTPHRTAGRQPAAADRPETGAHAGAGLLAEGAAELPRVRSAAGPRMGRRHP
ncbi:hypothetical protein [Kitasatospora sp. NPDC089509]|uniref:hypothetical protein n=1 Tax=Kitasatospora sp. NPDC089509 TaxID=3364079 RepID=UPI00382D1075